MFKHVSVQGLDVHRQAEYQINIQVKRGFERWSYADLETVNRAKFVKSHSETRGEIKMKSKRNEHIG